MNTLSNRGERIMWVVHGKNAKGISYKRSYESEEMAKLCASQFIEYGSTAEVTREA